MIEKRFKKLMGFIQDNTCERGDVKGVMDLTEIEDMLNELFEENKRLQKKLSDCEKFRYSVFKGMEKIIEEKKNDNGGFQVWEVPPIPQGKRITFSTTTERSGKND